ncbi:MAG: hypothetical protein AVDCRST_MAG93-6882, partial [uncultured Chloroflexia bacterium]
EATRLSRKDVRPPRFAADRKYRPRSRYSGVAALREVSGKKVHPPA